MSAVGVLDLRDKRFLIIGATGSVLSFVASYQPRWNSAEVVRRFDLPKQMTVSDYLDANFVRS